MNLNYKKYNNNNKKNKLNETICVNCGEKGHIIKSCIKPITSFGIIVFKIVYSESDEIGDKNADIKEMLYLSKINSTVKYPKIKLLMIQRKDTMGFIDFIRGKYPSYPFTDKYRIINVFLNEMTFNEKHMLKTLTFKQIWDYLWCNHNSRLFKNEYEQAYNKYCMLDIQGLLNNSDTYYHYSEWGFPKGRRNIRETNIQCAEREFSEETGFDNNTYDFVTNYPTIKEEFIGTNDINYKHIYYLVKMKDNVHSPKVDYSNKTQIGEVRNIGWFDVNECTNLIRPYDSIKKEIILDIFRNIEDNYADKNYNNIEKLYLDSDNFLIDTQQAVKLNSQST